MKTKYLWNESSSQPPRGDQACSDHIGKVPALPNVPIQSGREVWSTFLSGVRPVTMHGLAKIGWLRLSECLCVGHDWASVQLASKLVKVLKFQDKIIPQTESKSIRIQRNIIEKEKIGTLVFVDHIQKKKVKYLNYTASLILNACIKCRHKAFIKKKIIKNGPVLIPN